MVLYVVFHSLLPSFLFFFAGKDEVQGVGNRGIRKHRPGIYWTFFWSKYWQSFGQNIRRP